MLWDVVQPATVAARLTERIVLERADPTAADLGRPRSRDIRSPAAISPPSLCASTLAQLQPVVKAAHGGGIRLLSATLGVALWCLLAQAAKFTVVEFAKI